MFQSKMCPLCKNKVELGEMRQGFSHIMDPADDDDDDSTDWIQRMDDLQNGFQD
jgi:sarcosine oxidase delta subunit